MLDKAPAAYQSAGQRALWVMDYPLSIADEVTSLV